MGGAWPKRKPSPTTPTRTTRCVVRNESILLLTFFESPGRLLAAERPSVEAKSGGERASVAWRRNKRRQGARARGREEGRRHRFLRARVIFFHSFVFFFRSPSLLCPTLAGNSMRGLLSAARRTGVLGGNSASSPPQGLLPSRRVPSAGLGPSLVAEARKTGEQRHRQQRRQQQQQQQRRLPPRAASATAEGAPSPAPVPSDASQGEQSD